MGSIPYVSLLKGPAVPSSDHVRLHQLFSQGASKYPDQPALIYEDVQGVRSQLSFSEVDRLSNRLSRAILRYVATPPRDLSNYDGDRPIVVCLPPSPDLLLVLLAVWKCGAAYLPLLPDSPPDRTRFILGEVQPFLVIAQNEDEFEVFEKVEKVTVSTLKKMSAKMSEEEITEAYPTSGDSIEIILYTSGSTGLSKGVRLKSSSILNRLEWQWKRFPFTPTEDVCVLKTSLTFVDSVSEMWAPLLCPDRPRPLLIVPREVTTNPHHLVNILHRYKIGRLVLVPSLLKSILTYLGLENQERLLEKLKLWVCSGETLSVALASQFFDVFHNGRYTLCNFYGSTEVMGDVTYHVMNTPQDINYDNKVPIGIPVNNSLVYLLDQDLEIVTSGEMGEIYVAGRNVAAGYVCNRDSDKFVESPHTCDPDYKLLYKTGDYGRVVKGVLVYEGRTDSQIKVRGHRVDSLEVEVALNKIAGVQKGVVLCYHPGETDQELLGFVLLEDDACLNCSEIEDMLLRNVPHYALPKIIIVEKVPFLVNGKVDRQYLLRHYTEIIKEQNVVCHFDYSDIPLGKKYEAECLFETVSSVLGHSVRGKISASANFYKIGGNSLNSIFTIGKLKEKGYTISITDFIKSENLGEVIEKMSLDNHCSYEIPTGDYIVKIIEENDKADVYRIIGDSFCTKSDIELSMHPPVQRWEYDDLLDGIWPTILQQNLSIIVKNLNGESLGVSLYFDKDDEPEVVLKSQLGYILDFLGYIEMPLLENVLPTGKLLHSFMLGTNQRLGPQENVELTTFMETKTEELAKDKGFVGIFTTNTSPLTQQLSTKILNYRVLTRYQINQYVAPDGTRPFKTGADDIIAECAFKEL